MTFVAKKKLGQIGNSKKQTPGFRRIFDDDVRRLFVYTKVVVHANIRISQRRSEGGVNRGISPGLRVKYLMNYISL